MIKISLILGRSLSEESLRLAKQLGVDEIVGVASNIPQSNPDVWEFMPLLQLRKRIEDAGLQISIIDSTPPIDKVKLGLPGRDKQIDNFCTTLENMGAAGIRRITFNFTPLLTTRTSRTTRTRGGAQVTSFDMDLVTRAPLTEYGVVTEEKMWDNWTYFIKKVIPVAEEADVRLAIHPDDPPVPSLRGIARPFTSFEGFKRLIETVDSEYNGISFCIGCWSEMGEDVPKAIRYFGKRGRINFVHFRDVKGTATKFAETFHDDGQTDMLVALRALKEVDYDGPVRPDHQPRTEGVEALPEYSGYRLLGKFYGIAYLKGMMEAVYGKPPSSPLLL